MWWRGDIPSSCADDKEAPQPEGGRRWGPHGKHLPPPLSPARSESELVWQGTVSSTQTRPHLCTELKSTWRRVKCCCWDPWGTIGRTRAGREGSLVSGVACALSCWARPALSLLFLNGLAHTLPSILRWPLCRGHSGAFCEGASVFSPWSFFQLQVQLVLHWALPALGL